MRRWSELQPLSRLAQAKRSQQHRTVSSASLELTYFSSALKRRVWVSSLAIVIFLIFGASFCFAHSIKVFATTEGETITGYAYSRGGERIRNQSIFIKNTAGNLLGETRTDENGEFRFTATSRCDHVIVLELADGHRASFTVTADELPDKLPSEDEATENSPSPESPAEKAIATHEDLPLTDQGISLEDIKKIVEKSVSQQIRPLREQLEEYEATVRWHDTLGGIGYILGIMGVVFYFLSARKKAPHSSSDSKR